jgi:ABC-type dipeptide/oligopeptide/nickel transport system permease subunit
MDVSNSSGAIEPPHTPPLLRVSLLCGFIALACQLILNYVLRAHACYAHSTTILHAVTACALALVFVGLLLGFAVLRSLPAEKDEEGGKPHDRAHFQALLAFGFNSGFAVAIIALAIPAWLVPPC